MKRYHKGMKIPENLLTHPSMLVNLTANQPVVTFPQGLQGKADFNPHYKHIQIALESLGIDIPVQVKSLKKKVYPSDPEFGCAFYEFYYFPKMDLRVFVWKPVN